MVQKYSVGKAHQHFQTQILLPEDIPIPLQKTKKTKTPQKTNQTNQKNKPKKQTQKTQKTKKEVEMIASYNSGDFHFIKALIFYQDIEVSSIIIRDN